MFFWKKIISMVKSKLLLFTLIISLVARGQDDSDPVRKALGSTVTVRAIVGSVTRQASGFFVGDHVIVTNYHVIKGASSANCFSDEPGKTYKIEGSVNEDEEADLILLKVAQLNQSPLMLSAALPAAGMPVYIIGRPSGSSVISEGTVSSVRQKGALNQLVLNAYASADNSGGPVLNDKGEVLGVSLGSKEGQKVQLAATTETLQELLSTKNDTVLTLAELNAPEPEALPVDIARDAEVIVKASDFKNNILPNEVIIFKSKKDQSEYQGKTDSTGGFSLHLPAGDDYEIFILGFKDSTSYNLLKIPTLGKNEFFKKPFKVDVRFRPSQSFVLEGVNFNSGKATLTPDSYTVLDELVGYMNRKDDDRIEVGGHTDNVGKPEFNLKLSLDRANTVRDYLISKGIDPARIVAKGYGQTKPVADNKTEDGRATNRRTEVTVLE
jgi:hypothetical protein